MKFLRIALALSIILPQPALASSTPTTQTAELRGQAYLENCDAAMALFSRDRKETFEKKLVEMADTPAKMLQLVYDYDLVFSKDFSLALQATLLDMNVMEGDTVTIFRKFARLIKMPKEQFSEFIWQVVNNAVEMKTRASSDAKGQVAYIQARSFVESLKVSPHRQFFEDIVETVVRSSLVQKAKNHLSGADILELRPKYSISPDEVRFKKSIYIGFATFFAPIIGGLIYGGLNGVFLGGGVSFGGPDFQNSLFGATGIGFLVWLGLLPVLGHTSTYVVKRIDDAFVNRTLDLPIVNYGVTQAEKSVTIASNSIFTFLEKETDHGVLSVEEGCNQSVCNLTPAQIAYLGHVEVLELEALKKTLGEAFGSLRTSKDVEEISGAARAVYDDPSSYSKQMILNEALTTFLEKTSVNAKIADETAQALTAAVDRITQKDIDALTVKPYSERPRTADGRLKNEMLLAKIQNDMGSLKNIRLQSEAIARQSAKILAVRAKLEVMRAQLPKGPTGWREAAENIILEIDELK